MRRSSSISLHLDRLSIDHRRFPAWEDGPVRTRGWQGDPPRDDDEARARVLAAAIRCLHPVGPGQTRLAYVAAPRGVTRQTVYRYFSSVAEMLSEVGRTQAGAFLDRMAAELSFVT